MSSFSTAGLIRTIRCVGAKVSESVRAKLFGEAGLLSPSCAAISIALSEIESMRGLKMQEVASTALMRRIGQNLVKISLWNLDLTGCIPDAIGDNCVNIEFLHLGGNPRMTGCIPENWGNLHKLQTVCLWETGVSGPIPSNFFSGATEVRQMHFFNTNLSGPIPDTIGQMKKLQHLRLDGTKLSGSIPVTLTELTQLTSINLDDTDLTVPEGATKMAVENTPKDPNAVINFLSLIKK